MQAIILLSLLVSVATAAQPESNTPVQTSAQVIGNSPSVSSQGHDASSAQQIGSEANPAHGLGYYAPAGMITIVGAEPTNQVYKSVPIAMRNFEQYGQPEPTSLPPNYKPFGSWGLYIGGSPADGYYTDYYKHLGGSVDKQQGAEHSTKPVASQTTAFNPILRQAGFSPYVGGDYYPYVYSPAELNSVVHSQISPVHYEGSGQFLGISYADSYANKRIGSIRDEPSKAADYQPSMYGYPSFGLAAPSVQLQQQQQQQLVAYPIPVDSQIVGSQSGVDGSFNPYGVHAFTRYAIKPALVSHEPSYTLIQGTQNPSYKQQSTVVSPQPTSGSSLHYPLSYFGFPSGALNQRQEAQNQQASVGLQPTATVEATSGKVEDKPASQKRA